MTGSLLFVFVKCCTLPVSGNAAHQQATKLRPPRRTYANETPQSSCVSSSASSSSSRPGPHTYTHFPFSLATFFPNKQESGTSMNSTKPVFLPMLQTPERTGNNSSSSSSSSSSSARAVTSTNEETPDQNHAHKHQHHASSRSHSNDNSLGQRAINFSTLQPQQQHQHSRQRVGSAPQLGETWIGLLYASAASSGALANDNDNDNDDDADPLTFTCSQQAASQNTQEQHSTVGQLRNWMADDDSVFEVRSTDLANLPRQTGALGTQDYSASWAVSSDTTDPSYKLAACQLEALGDLETPLTLAQAPPQTPPGLETQAPAHMPRPHAHEHDQPARAPLSLYSHHANSQQR